MLPAGWERCARAHVCARARARGCVCVCVCVCVFVCVCVWVVFYGLVLCCRLSIVGVH